MIKIFVKRKKRKKEFLVFLPSIKIIFKSLAHSLAQHPSPPPRGESFEFTVG